MSIHAYIISSDFSIPHNALHDVFEKSYKYIVEQESKFPTSIDTSQIHNLFDLLDQVHLDYRVDDNKNVAIIGHDNVLTYGTSILEIAAGYVKNGSFVQWEEEDGTIRYDEVINGKYIWGDPVEED